MSRRKQAKPQHLKSDEELPPPEGAPDHGEGPRGGGGLGRAGRRGDRAPRMGKVPGSSEPVSAARRPARAGGPRGPVLRRSALRGVADEVNLAQLLGVGELRAGLGGGGRGPHRLFRAPRLPGLPALGPEVGLGDPGIPPAGAAAGTRTSLTYRWTRAGQLCSAPGAPGGARSERGRRPDSGLPPPRTVRLVRPEAAVPRVPAR